MTYYGVGLDLSSPITPTGCPVAGMDVYATGTAQLSRIRFMVYQQAGGANLGLYMQTMNTAAAPAFNQVPTMVEPGIEDMQVRPMVVNYSGSVCSDSICGCNDAPTGSCTYDTASSPDAMLLALRSVSINLTSRGVITTTSSTPGGYRPASYNHPAGSVDNLLHRSAEISIMLPNISLSTL